MPRWVWPYLLLLLFRVQLRQEAFSERLWALCILGMVASAQVAVRAARQFCWSNGGMQVEKGPQGAPNLDNGKSKFVKQNRPPLP